MGNASDSSNKKASLFAAFDDALEEEGFGVDGYEILSEIDRGGMGVVYHARQLRPEREVALKVMLPKLGADREMRKRFQTEARAMAALDHPGILPIYEVGESNGLPYFSMKLASGGSMSDRLKGEPIDGKVAATWLCEISSAVNHAHQRGVLHRDLKPANFLFDEDGRLYVADFGVAKLLASENLNLTKTEGFVGTPHYMPPEVASGSANEVTVLGDLYSLGAVLYECLTGERPHRQHSHIGPLLRAIAEEPITRPRSLRPGLPLDVDIICQKALEKSPNDRYSSVRSFREDLLHWLEGRPIKARPVGLPERAWRWSRRHPLTATLSISLAGLAIVGGGLLSQSYHQQREIALQESRLENARSARLLGASGFREHVLDLLRKAASRGQSERIRSEAVATLAKIDMTPLVQASEGKTPAAASTWPPSSEGDETIATTSSPDDQWTLTWHASGQLALWRASELEPRRLWNPGPLNEIQAAFIPEGLGLLMNGTDLGTVAYSGPELTKERRLTVSDLSTFRLSPDGSRAAFGTGEGLEVFDMKSGDRLWSAKAGPRRCAPSWSSDGRTVAVALGNMKQVTLYDAHKGGPLLVRSTSGWPQQLAFHPRGQFLGIVSDNDTLMLMDLVAGNFLTPVDLPVPSNEVTSFRFSEDGSALSVGTVDGGTYSWQLHQAVGYREWSGHATTSTGISVFGAKLSHDERFLLTMTTEGIEIWSTEDGCQTGFHRADNQRIDARTDAWWLPGPEREIMVQVPGALERVSIDAVGNIVASEQVDREPGTTVLDIQEDGDWRVKVLDEDGEPSFACWVQGDPKLSKALASEQPLLTSSLLASSRDGACLAEVLDTNVVQLSGKRGLILTPPIHTKFRQILFAHEGDRLIGVAEDYRIFDWDLERLDHELEALGFR